MTPEIEAWITLIIKTQEVLYDLYHERAILENTNH